jgi:hypothetical protein
VLPLTRTLRVLVVWAWATGVVVPSNRAARAVRAMLQAVVGSVVFISGIEGVNEATNLGSSIRGLITD